MKEQIFIGKVKVEKTAVLAPMAGISDSAFRRLCKEFGAALVTSEMISAKAICYKNQKTYNLLKFCAQERPIAVQIFGFDPNDMAEAAKIIAETAAPDIIDINMGCPAPKIANNFSGSHLMKNPVLVGQIIEKVCHAVSLPVTVKIRKGWSKDTVNAKEIAKIAQESGAAAITVHGRTKEEMFSGVVDMQIIKRVKAAVKIPVVGNGDVWGPKSAQIMYDKTKCDLVMVGRGALGRPWVFGQIKAGLKGGKIPEPSWEDVAQIMLRHGRMLCEEFAEESAMKQMRKHVIWYIKGLKNSTKLKNKACFLKTYPELVELAKQVVDLAHGGT